MNENIKNTLKIDEILGELQYLKEENKQLKADNKVLGDELTYFKEYAVDLEEQVNNLTSENVNLKARNLALSKRVNWLTSEEAGKQLAKELLGAGQ